MISLLTNLYDGRDFDYMTRGRGQEFISNPCLSLLGASTVQWIKEAIPQVAIGGGFTSRVIFVFQDTFEKLIPWPALSPENIKRFELLAQDLNQVSKMHGTMVMTEDAKRMYNKEYVDFYTNSPLFDTANLAGYAGRRHTNLLKVCMAVSASSSDDRIIGLNHVSLALELLSRVERDMPRVLQAISNEFFGDVCEECLTILMNRGTIVRSDLLKLMRHKLSSRQLDVVLEQFVEEQILEVGNRSGMPIYKYIGDKKK
jgi:hypothetical protein